MSDFTHWTDLAAARIGGKALLASDEFFAEKENLLKADRGIFIADKYTDRGKWMDGWESRRKRTPGHDWCIIKLGLPGNIFGVDIDTNFFTGNHPESASVEGCEAASDASAEDLARANWIELVPQTRLQGGSQNLFSVSHAGRFTHVRLNIFPDGGVARFRVHGRVVPDWPRLVASGASIDLLAVENGGRALLANDMYFSHKDNLIMPGKSANMGDGWETKRKRGPGHDWAILQLGRAGIVSRVEIDTGHFKGNYPDRCSLDVAGDAAGGANFFPDVLTPDFVARVAWRPLLPEVKLGPAKMHVFEKELLPCGPFSHVRLNIFPDGGIARLRMWGRPSV